MVSGIFLNYISVISNLASSTIFTICTKAQFFSHMKSFLMTIVLPDKQHDEYDHMFIGAEEEEVDNSRKKSLALRS